MWSGGVEKALERVKDVRMGADRSMAWVEGRGRYL